jgi:hypothetical protein
MIEVVFPGKDGIGLDIYQHIAEEIMNELGKNVQERVRNSVCRNSVWYRVKDHIKEDL